MKQALLLASILIATGTLTQTASATPSGGISALQQTTCGLNFRRSSAHATCNYFNTDGSGWAGCVINATCLNKAHQNVPTSIKVRESQVHLLQNCDGQLKLSC